MSDPLSIHQDNEGQAPSDQPATPSPTRNAAQDNQQKFLGGGRIPPPRADECTETVVPDYALLFFDHLYSEYLTLKPLIQDDSVTNLLDAIYQKRRGCQLAWSDVYSFDLSLVKVRPPVSLIRKAYDARARYRSFAGQKEYDEYVASNPPNLVEIKVAPDAVPPEPDLILETRLRADVEYLLSKFYLYYATLPARERLRDELTQRAVRRTLIFVGVLFVLILLNLGIVTIAEQWTKLSVNAPGLTILTVALAGIVGGCVSTLQRIQSAPSEGDALFNLAALNNGWTGLSLSPVYGGIFAALLFILFAAGILQGSVFPDIRTPGKPAAALVTPSPAASPTATPTVTPPAGTSTPPTETASPTATATVAATASPVGSPESNVSNTQATARLNPPESEAAKNTAAQPILRVKTFLEETGPVDGVAYALLIVWSFLAGFAERLVPDTLNRLVAKNQAIQGQ